MNVVISDPKTGKAYSKKVDDAGFFMNRKIGEEVSLSAIGLDGYSAKISGGSDKQGFPMKSDMHGTARRQAMITKESKTGTKAKKSFRGNVVSEEIQQLNLVVTKEGNQKLEDVFGKVGEEKAEKAVENKEGRKEKAGKEKKKEKPREAKKDEAAEGKKEKAKGK